MRDPQLFALFCMQSTLTNQDDFTHGWDFNTSHAIGFYTALEGLVDFNPDNSQPFVSIGELVLKFAAEMADYLPLDKDLDHVKITSEWLLEKGILKKYSWSCSSGSVYGWWDCGEVYATSEAAAYKKAQAEFVANVDYVNNKMGETLLEINSNEPSITEIK